MTALEVACWACALLIVYAQLGYPLLLALLGRVRGGRSAPPPVAPGGEPLVSLVVAAHAEAGVIEAKVANALALDWPRERLEVVIACDGSPDDTPARARAAGADVVLELPWGGKVRAQDAAGERARGGARGAEVVLELPWGGKVRAQDAAVERARGELVAFSDANALWEPGALRALAA